MNNITVKELKQICFDKNIKNYHNLNKSELIKLINNSEYVSEIFSENEYQYLYHISDIHIGALGRIDEYYQVFNKLYNKLRKEKSGLIVITGDIIDKYGRVSSEARKLCNDFFNNLKDIMPVVCILGNHDTVMNNSNRLDELTTLISDKCYLLKKKGYYSCKNITFSVPDIYNNIVLPPFKEKRKQIALFHGIVEGSINNLVYSTKLIDFDKYDYVLLGDIHKHQFIKHNIAYAGSLIQQNHGEDLKNHGYIRWNIKSGKSKFVKIENDYGFIQIKVSNGKWEKPKYIPKFPRIRLDYENTSNIQFEEIKKQFPSCIQWKYKHIIKNQIKLKGVKNTININDIILENIKDKDIINYYNNIWNKSNNTYLTEYQTWCIDKIEFKNCFKYGGDHINKINFKSGVCSIQGKNAIGKSSILYIILWGLFGSKAIKNMRRTYIINNKSLPNNYFIKTYITIGDNHYIIERTAYYTNKTHTDITNKTKLYHKFKLEEYKNISSKSETEIQKKINNIIGTSDNFLNCNVFSNTLGNNIITMSETNLYNTMSSVFNIDVFKIMLKFINNDLKNLQKEYIKLKGNIEGITSVKKDIKEELINEMRNSKYSEELDKLINKNLNWKDVKLEEYMNVNENINDLSKIIEEGYDECNYDLNKMIVVRDELLEKIENMVDVNVDITVNLDTIVNLDKKILALERKYNSCTQTDINKYNNFCKKYIIDDKIKSKYLNKYFKLRKRIDIVDKEKLNKLYCKKLYIINNNIKKCLKKEKYFESLKKYNILKNIDIYKIHSLIKDGYNNTDITPDYKLIYEFEKQQEYSNKINIIKSEVLNLDKKIKICMELKNLLSKDKIPYLILDKKLKVVEEYMNIILQEFVEFYVEFNTNNDKINIIIHKDNKELCPTQCSGFEKFIMDVSIKYSLMINSNYNKSEIFFIDEGLDCIDEYNFAKLDILFNKLREIYNNIFIITHIKNTLSDNQIIITENKEYSYIY